MKNDVKLPSPVSVSVPSRPYACKIVVPSNGYLYGGKWSGGEMIISPLTVAEEKLLAGSKGDRFDVLDLIVKRCIVECPVPFEDLLVGDLFYIMMCIRNISYGSDYSFNLTCGNCGTFYVHRLQIPDDLSMSVLTEEDDCEPYEVRLPLRGDLVKFRLLRYRDEMNIRRQLRLSYRSANIQGDPSYSYRLATYIQSVNDQDMNLGDKVDYVESLAGKDSLALRDAIDGREFGISLIIKSQCPDCGYEDESILPFNREFFRPGSTRR